jgi:hypothetical protein
MCIVPHNTFYLTSVTATTQETRNKRKDKYAKHWKYGARTDGNVVLYLL